jgi:hypothetical protein
MRGAEYLIRFRGPWLVLGIGLLLLPACAVRELAFQPERHGRPAGAGELAAKAARQRLCRDYPPYVPDESANGRRVRDRVLQINYHIVNAADSSRNFLAEVGTPYVRQLTREINQKLSDNLPMSLPAARDVPVLPTRFRLQITPIRGADWDDGVYYHFDDSLYAYVHKGRHRNNSDRRVIDRYAIRPDSVINIFVLPHHPDSVGSPTYPAGGVGIALGMAMKISGLYEHGLPPSDFAGLTLHEIGHILGLSHTWQFNDGCEDTPHHPNCFNVGPSPCDSLLSNNVMDYNTWQQAWTPCQLGKVHRNMARREGTARPYLERDWCVARPDGDVQVAAAEVWEGEVDLYGNLDILPGGHLTIRCRVSMPSDTRITVHPGGTLVLDGAWLHNDCGLSWQGIRLLSQGRGKGRVYLGEDWKIETDATQVPD